MNELPMLPTLARSVWHDFLRARRELVVYEILFKLAESWVLAPGVALLLLAVQSQAGHVALSNQDIVDFLLTPLGILYAALFTTFAAALLLVEQAGVMALMALRTSSARPAILPMLRRACAKSVSIVQLGAMQAGLLALVLVPFVVVGVLTVRGLLWEHDFYYYWKERPPVFWIAASIVSVLLVAALALGAWLCVRWAFALPILLFENRHAGAALRASGDRVHGAVRQVALIVLGWLFSVLLIGVAAEVGFRFVARAVVAVTGDTSVVLISLLIAHGGLIASVSFVLVVGLGLVTRRLYLLRGEQLGLGLSETCPKGAGSEQPVSPWSRRLAWLSLPLFLLAPLAIWFSLAAYKADRPMVQVTAHRGAARAAPENTLSAMRKAIEIGANYIEMDVQQTADGVVVLLHDRDLKRVAGVSRRLNELSYHEVRELDVGSWFAPAFAGEHVPRLVEVFDLCRGKIRLNIEMKFFGPDRRLTQAVAQMVRDRALESECIVTSLNYGALVLARQHNPRLRTGLIVASALGDLSLLDVDVLSVRADFLSDDLIRAAHRSGREVHVWTVNDAAMMRRFIMRGVDNIITSDPELAIRVRNEWATSTESQRLLLSSQVLLGIEP
jgi:glycerophosphoryl diester phosphodiesterase